jgi:hypothetical protein
MQDDDRYRASAFAARNGLTLLEGIGDSYYNLIPFAESREHYKKVVSGLQGPTGWRDRKSTLFDHGLRFKRAGQRGPAKVVAITTSPYVSSMLDGYRSEEAALNDAYAVATAFGVNVRVGHESDRTYFPNGVVVPILWWKPAEVGFTFLQASEEKPE